MITLLLLCRLAPCSVNTGFLLRYAFPPPLPIPCCMVRLRSLDARRLVPYLAHSCADHYSVRDEHSTAAGAGHSALSLPGSFAFSAHRHPEGRWSYVRRYLYAAGGAVSSNTVTLLYCWHCADGYLWRRLAWLADGCSVAAGACRRASSWLA